MADLTIFEKYPNSWRLDHPDFGHVCKTTYAKGVITAFYEADSGDAPPVVRDFCDIEIDGKEFKEIPIIYHPPRSYVENWKLNIVPGIHLYNYLFPEFMIPAPEDSEVWQAFWEASGSLMDKEDKAIVNDEIPEDGLPYDNQTIARGAYSFSIGDEVAVMLRENEPVAVIGFADGIPRRPFDYVKVEMPPQVMDFSDPTTIGDPECPYIIQLSDPARLSADPDMSGPDGFDLKLLKDAQVFPDKVESTDDSAEVEFSIDFNYYCFYEGSTIDHWDISLFISLYAPEHWNPPPDPAFGPLYGYMHYEAIWSIGIPDWATYLAQWKGTCDTIQDQHYDGGWVDLPYLGLWPSRDGVTSLGRPLFWAIIASSGNATGSTEFVMRTYLIEAGPMLYIIRVFYRHAILDTTMNFYLWKDRIVWPYNAPAPPGWAGYAPGNEGNYTAPIWMDPDMVNPYPTQIEDCVPQPDDSFEGETNHAETFYSDNPHYIYAVPSSKKILDDIDNIIAASNDLVNVQEVVNGTSYDSVQPPEGFKNIFGDATYSLPPGFIPPVGNLRELNFKIAERIGV